jgi:3-oxosteroid 1-dehydrogenase
MYKDNATTGGRSIPAWVIFDAHFRFNYAMGPLMPGQVMPDSRLRKEWLNTVYWKADTLDALPARSAWTPPASPPPCSR